MRKRKPMVDLRRMVIDWLGLDNTASQFQSRADELKVLMRDDLLVAQGEEDSDGHYWYTFDDAIEDPSGKADVTGLKREHRKSKTLNAERAEAFLRKRGLWDECTETVVVISEDAILAKAFDKVISDKDLNSLYDVKESYAFVPQRFKGRSR